MKNILFYKYVELNKLQKLRDSLYELCYSLDLLGKILIAHEGINGCLSGTVENTEMFIDNLRKYKEFADIEFKEGLYNKHTFKKLFVRIRSEIVSLRQNVKLKNKAKYIEPEELNKLLDSDEEVIMVDARNNYESKIGRFKGAVTPDIDTFAEWPQAIENFREHKDKRIVTYCTGGIRCEKASAYLIEHGFTNVQQLHGGIIKYGKVCGDRHWEGKCFVFDHRGAINIDPGKNTEPITQCELCYLPSDKYHNCNITTCDRMFLSCDKCLDILKNCCSKRCRGELLRKTKFN